MRLPIAALLTGTFLTVTVIANPILSPSDTDAFRSADIDAEDLSILSTSPLVGHPTPYVDEPITPPSLLSRLLSPLFALTDCDSSKDAGAEIAPFEEVVQNRLGLNHGRLKEGVGRRGREMGRA